MRRLRLDRGFAEPRVVVAEDAPGVLRVSRRHLHDYARLAVNHDRSPLDLIIEGRLNAVGAQLGLNHLGLTLGGERPYGNRFGVLIITIDASHQRSVENVHHGTITPDGPLYSATEPTDLASETCNDLGVRITIHGRNLPGRCFMSEGVPLENVHVAVQEGKEPVGLVPGDAASATWKVDVRIVVSDDGELDLRGPAVHGKRGERFLYLTWGDVGADGSFAMFRRAKLMVADIDSNLLAQAAEPETGAAAEGGGLSVEIDLTDRKGCPLCARVRPPTASWSLTS